MANEFMQEAIELAAEGMHNNQGGPFGAVIVKNGEIIGRGNNCVTSHNDPTAHAEVNAIRDACQHLNTFNLAGCNIYTSCEPCPMCLAAIYWARVDKIYWAASRHDAADIGFDDHFFYEEISKPIDQRTVPMHQLMHTEAQAVFAEWAAKDDKVAY